MLPTQCLYESKPRDESVAVMSMPVRAAPSYSQISANTRRSLESVQMSEGKMLEDVYGNTSKPPWVEREIAGGCSRRYTQSSRYDSHRAPLQRVLSICDGFQGDGSGMAHLVSAEAQKRTKQLARIEQKIIALLVKGNDLARRR